MCVRCLSYTKTMIASSWFQIEITAPALEALESGPPLDQLVYIEEVGFFAKHKLVGALEHEFYFPYIGNNHPNLRTHIFQRGLKPPTR